MAVKYVFVTGGVVSGLGKGITAASLGRLLKARGFKVTMQKFDPYINIDPGTMNPIQHGEVFVTDDGAETDLDLGHYERFIDESLNKNSNVTTGKVYWSVLQKERRGDFGGGTVQVIPHITNEIKSRFYRDYSTDETKIAIIEVGGTVGDIESQPFLEAIRQFQREVGRENAILIHVTLIPYLKASGEMKTKPTQASVKELQGMGIQPDILVCRTEHPLEPGIKDKIALFCNVPKSHVLQNLDVEILYDAPLAMEEEHLAQVACECLELECPEPDLDEWRAMCKAWKNPTKKVTVALVGKYIQLHDAYISVVEALKHGGVANSCDVTIKWVDSETVTADNVSEILSDVSGILVPGGFGDRGIEGKIQAIRYARENNIPFLGLCLGMQLSIVEFARDVIGYEDAHSVELKPDTTHPVIHLMPELDSRYRQLETKRLRDCVRGWKPELYLDEIEDEYAIACMLYDMREYLDSEKEIYPLRDALQDSYMALLLQEAVMSEGCKIHSQPMPWNQKNAFRLKIRISVQTIIRSAAWANERTVPDTW